MINRYTGKFFPEYFFRYREMNRLQKYLLPPDLYSRNTILSFLIQKLIGGGNAEELRILDVGGYGGKLAWFLPENIKITILDQRERPKDMGEDEGEYRQGDARKIPFSDGNFDMVVASDMLEHVKQEDRTFIIKELLRVSKNHVLLGGPCASDLIQLAEKYIQNQFLNVTGTEHPFLKEHLSFGLPRETKIEEVITRNSSSFFKLGEGNLMNWYIQQQYSCTQHEFDPCNERYQFHKFFNEHLNELGTLRAPTYRTIFCIAKQGDLPEAEIRQELSEKNIWNPERFMEALHMVFSDIHQVVVTQKEKLAYLEKTGGTQENQFAALQETLNTLRREYEDAIARDQHSKQQLQQYEQQIKDLEARINKARESVKIYKDAIEEARQFLREKENAMHLLKELAREKEQKISELSGELQGREKFILKLHEDGEKKDTEIEYLRGHIINKETILLEQENRLKEQSSSMENMRHDLESHQRELRRVVSSKAWKVIMRYGNTKEKILQPARLIRKGWDILTHMGPHEFTRRLHKKIKGKGAKQVGEKPYGVYIHNEQETKLSPAKAQKEIATWAEQPVVSIIVPVYNIKQEWLEACIESVKNQWYPKWELCLCDDASTDSYIRPLLQKYAQEDARIKVSYRMKNGGIVKASNDALQLATGSYIGFLDCDDTLASDALFEVIKVLQEDKYDLVYSDEDKLDPQGNRCDPFFKPDWSPDLLFSQNYISHFSVYRAKLVAQLDGLREGFDGSQDYDLVLRVTEKTTKIKHIPKILYHWRMVPGSTAAVVNAKPYAFESAKKALESAMKRRNIGGTVSDGVWKGSYRVQRDINGQPLVSIIIPFKDKPEILRACMESILEKTTWKNYEIILIDNQSILLQTQDYLKKLAEHENVKVHRYDKPFNYSAINNFAAQQSKGEYLILLNNDTEVISPDWIESMLEHAQRPEVGAVGAKLLYPNKLIQHAGVVMGLNGLANHVFRQIHKDDLLYFGQADVIRNYSAVTAACVMMRKKLYLEIGGLNEQDLVVAFNDVDICLRLREKGYLIIYTPFAQLYHHESLSRGFHVDIKEVDYMQRKYRGLLEKGDPYYNKNLSLERFDFSLRIEDVAYQSQLR